MDKQLLERRTKMLQQHLMGIPLKLIVENLEKESGATAKNLYHDWERRRQWIPQVVQLDDPTLLKSFLESAYLMQFDKTTAFLPWIVGSDGKTLLKDVIIPRLNHISDFQALHSEDQIREEEKRMARKIIDIPKETGE